MKNATLRPASNPKEVIGMIAYPGQKPQMRQWRSGYNGYIGELPQLSNDDPLLSEKVGLSKSIMQHLAGQLRHDKWPTLNMPAAGEFARTIIGIEEPEIECNGLPGGKIVKKEGVELIVAQWGIGNSSPIHGHAPGFLHEEILYGKLRVNTYRQPNPQSNVVIPVATTIETAGTFASVWSAPNPHNPFKRPGYIHNFTAITESATLHYVPEHTRDGRDNTFQVRHFDDVFEYGNADLRRITAKEGMYLRKGEVALVRSANVPEYGDHYIVITGAPEMKEHGLRPKDIAIDAPNAAKVLDRYEMEMGLTLLHLTEEARDAFHQFHGITMQGGEVIFPTA